METSRMSTGSWWCSLILGVKVYYVLVSKAVQGRTILRGSWNQVFKGSRYAVPKEGLPKSITNLCVTVTAQAVIHVFPVEDTVYLPEEADREEYIMNASGIIWAGAHNDMFTWPWNFAQVSPTINSVEKQC